MERSTEASRTQSPSEEREIDEGPGLCDASMQPVVKLYRMGMYCLIYYCQGSHGHDISGKVLKLENTISSTGNVLE